MKRFDIYCLINDHIEIWSILANSYSEACQKLNRIRYGK